jgi:two-component system LytT family response regulator
MGERMLLANLDSNALFYTILIIGFAAAATLNRRRAVEETIPECSPLIDEALTIRARGGFVRVPVATIDMIKAAGDYCEVHASGSTHLLDEPLASLANRLPGDRFARIHRQAIVDLSRVTEVRGVGRGDAVVRMANGTELRLSRRYRAQFLERLGARSTAAAVPPAD